MSGVVLMFVVGRELSLLRIKYCMNWENKKNNSSGRYASPQTAYQVTFYSGYETFENLYLVSLRGA